MHARQLPLMEQQTRFKTNSPQGMSKITQLLLGKVRSGACSERSNKTASRQHSCSQFPFACEPLLEYQTPLNMTVQSYLWLPPGQKLITNSPREKYGNDKEGSIFYIFSTHNLSTCMSGSRDPVGNAPEIAFNFLSLNIGYRSESIRRCRPNLQCINFIM